MIQSEILFLKQEEVIEAGLLDMKQILDACTKTYELLGQGEIINHPKTSTRIPDPVNWTSFFNSMPCYIGGDIKVGGIKWACESKKNAETPGIPYGIDIEILSDPDTVLPFAIMDATLITAMRTSAVAGLFAKYTAPKNCKVATLVGAGVIGRTALMAVNETVPTLETVYLCDLDLKKAEDLAAEFKGKVNFEIIPATDSKACAEKSTLVITQTTSRTPFVTKDWVKKGMTFINMAGFEMELDVLRESNQLFVDYWTQIITNSGKAVTKLYNAGEIKKDDVVELADLVLGKHPGRKTDDEILYCSSMGLGALDAMIAYAMYKNAKEKGLGTVLKQWDKPLWE
ncbi:MAG: ornithine cyclodeaminase family protein [Clostridia bacterium]|nr:ornithine cyclodeaminase family protein [Clostridia bacterium]